MKIKFLLFYIVLCAFFSSSYAMNEYVKKADYYVNKSKIDSVFYYKKSIEEYPYDIDGFIGLAKLRMHDKEYVQALTNLLKAKDVNEDNFSVNYYLGEYHYERKNFYKAIKYYKKAQNIKKKRDEKLWIKMGKTYEKLADITNAKNAYVSALSLNSKNLATLNRLKRLDKLTQKQEHKY